VGGPLDGVEGILVAHDGDRKLIVSINLIQRSVAVSLHNSDIQSVAGQGRGVGIARGWN
jgi:hypothetical protein